MLPFTTTDIKNPFNQPSKVVFDLGSNGIEITVQLPEDVIIGIDGQKVIAESKILDGTVVYERVSRKPCEVNFDFTVWDEDVTKNTIFPQEKVTELYQTLWRKDQVVKVINTFLNNAFGIFYLICEPITFITVRGSKKVIGTLKAKEVTPNTVGTTLIIPL